MGEGLIGVGLAAYPADLYVVVCLRISSPVLEIRLSAGDRRRQRLQASPEIDG